MGAEALLRSLRSSGDASSAAIAGGLDERKEEVTNEARATMNEPYYWYRRDALKVVPNFH